MKINIITQPLFSNYGGILQNYALQEVLRRMGHEPLTINVPKREPSRGPVWKEMAKTGINLIKKLQGRYSSPFINPYTWAKKEYELSFPQRIFIKKHINKTDVTAPFAPELADQFPAEAWIVGSDQVWRPWCTPFIRNYFFDFLERSDVRRIAYSASFGTDRWEISESDTPDIKRLLQKFDAVSVREKSGVKLCKENCGVDAIHLLDPTMLLTEEDYLLLTKEIDHPEGKYIATYILDIDRNKTKVISGEATKFKLKVQSIGVMRKKGYDSIESWISTIAHSDRVITDSFHGTVFSIIFNKPVMILGNKTRGNTRIDSLISFLRLKRNTLGYIIITDETKKIINEKREESISFLSRLLDK